MLVKNSGYHPLIAQPFYHLKSKGNFPLWWRVLAQPGCERWLENAGSMRLLRNLTSAIDPAEIDVELAVILTVVCNRQVLRQAVLQAYSPAQTSIDLSSVGSHFDRISYQIVNESPETYIARVQKLKKQFSGSETGRELFRQEILVRGGAFKKEVMIKCVH